jgi:hypothetical protein
VAVMKQRRGRVISSWKYTWRSTARTVMPRRPRGGLSAVARGKRWQEESGGGGRAGGAEVQGRAETASREVHGEDPRPEG